MVILLAALGLNCLLIGAAIGWGVSTMSWMEWCGLVLAGSPMTVSIGVVQFQADLSMDGLFTAADEALKRAQARGGNQTCVARHGVG